MNSIFESINLKNKLLIFEDFERSNINIVNILGYVNNLVEHDDAKILIVSNENEILKKEKTDGITDENTEKESGQQALEEINKYLKIKEKTIGNTIAFNNDIKTAIKSITEEFANNVILKILDDRFLDDITSTVNIHCKGNLRSYIFALQKTIEIINLIGEDKKERYYKSLLIGVLIYSTNIRKEANLKWDARGTISPQLGSKDYPLMKIAYDYIRWQEVAKEDIAKTVIDFDAYCFAEGQSEYKDDDLRILDNYDVEKEEDVYNSLKNLEEKLKNKETIAINYYCKLAYYCSLLIM